MPHHREPAIEDNDSVPSNINASAAAAHIQPKQQQVAAVKQQSQSSSKQQATTKPKQLQQPQHPAAVTSSAEDSPSSLQQQTGTVPPLMHAAPALGSKSGVSRTGSIKRHGSTTSRRLQALLASEELSSLSLLSKEGSELPGRDGMV